MDDNLGYEPQELNKSIEDRFNDILITAHTLLERIDEFAKEEGYDFDLEKDMIKSIMDNSNKL